MSSNTTNITTFIEIAPNTYAIKDEVLSGQSYKEYIEFQSGYFQLKNQEDIIGDIPLVRGVIDSAKFIRGDYTTSDTNNVRYSYGASAQAPTFQFNQPSINVPGVSYSLNDSNNSNSSYNFKGPLIEGNLFESKPGIYVSKETNLNPTTNVNYSYGTSTNVNVRPSIQLDNQLSYGTSSNVNVNPNVQLNNLISYGTSSNVNVNPNVQLNNLLSYGGSTNVNVRPSVTGENKQYIYQTGYDLGVKDSNARVVLNPSDIKLGAELGYCPYCKHRINSEADCCGTCGGCGGGSAGCFGNCCGGECCGNRNEINVNGNLGTDGDLKIKGDRRAEANADCCGPTGCWGTCCGGDVSGPKANLNVKGPQAKIDGEADADCCGGDCCGGKASGDANLRGPNVQVKGPNAQADADCCGPTSCWGTCCGGDCCGGKASGDANLRGPNVQVKGPNAQADADCCGPTSCWGTTCGADCCGGNASGDVNLRGPNVDVNAPNIKAPNVNLSGPSFRGPNVNLNGPNIQGPNVNLNGPNIQGPNVNLNGPNLRGPNVNLNAPNVQLKGPNAQADADCCGPTSCWGTCCGGDCCGGKASGDANLRGPNVNADGSYQIRGPQAEADTDCFGSCCGPTSCWGTCCGGDCCGGKVSGDANLRGPSGQINVPNLRGDVNLKAPSGQINVPNYRGDLDIKGPNTQFNYPNLKGDVDIKGPNAQYNLPNYRGDLDIKGPNTQFNVPNYQGDINLKGPNAQFNSPSVELYEPNFRGNYAGEVHYRGPQAQVNVPSVQLKGPNAQADADCLGSCCGPTSCWASCCGGCCGAKTGASGNVGGHLNTDGSFNASGHHGKADADCCGGTCDCFGKKSASVNANAGLNAGGKANLGADADADCCNCCGGKTGVSGSGQFGGRVGAGGKADCGARCTDSCNACTACCTNPSENCDICCKKCGIFHIFGLILAIILLVLGFLFLGKLVSQNTEYSYFKTVSQNWQTAPIAGVYVNSSLNNCTQADSLINYQWGGFVEGCDCNGTITRGACPGYKDDCTTVPPVPEVPITKWQNTSICQKKFVNTDSTPSHYFSLNIVAGNANCPKDYKSCGFIDSFKNILCIENKNNCPINNIFTTNYIYNRNFYFNTYYTPLINIPDDEIDKYTNVTIKAKNSDIRFANYYNPNYTEIPISFGTDFDTPCNNPYFIDNKYEMYVLDHDYGRQKCFEFADDINLDEGINTNNANYTKSLYIDNSYKLLDVYKEIDLLNDNNALDGVKITPALSRQLSNNIGLYGRSYLGMKAECHQKIRENNMSEEIYDSIKNLDNINAVRGVMIAIIVLVILSIIIIFVFLVFETCVGVRKSDSLLITVLWIMLFILLIFLIDILVLSIVNTSYLYAIDGLDEVFTANCMDAYASNAYQKYFVFIDASKTFIVICLLISIILLILYFIFLYFAWKKDWFISDQEGEYSKLAQQ